MIRANVGSLVNLTNDNAMHGPRCINIVEVNLRLNTHLISEPN